MVDFRFRCHYTIDTPKAQERNQNHMEVFSMTEIEKEAIRKARNAYRREWNKRNPEKVKAAQEKYWLKQAAKLEAESAGGGADAKTNA